MNKDQAKTEIKKHLWCWGYKVRDVTGLGSFDLLVDSKTRIKVVVATEADAREKRITSGCDVLAVYIVGKANGKRRLYSRGVEVEPDGRMKFEEYDTIPNQSIRGAVTP